MHRPIEHQDNPIPIVTIITKNYLAQARTLTESYLSVHPQGRVFVCLADRIDGYFDPTKEAFITVLAEDLQIDRWESLKFRYDLTELCTAAKPFFLEYLIRKYDLDRIIYFDPDIVIYAPLDELNTLLDTFGIVLTPHLLGPVQDPLFLTEVDLLKFGLYNLGFIALSRRADWESFLKWWQERLHLHCTKEFHKGLFTDQRWVDYVPIFFENVYLWRNPGCNVARWHLHSRLIEYVDGQFQIAGNDPLIFFHFSGFSIDNDNNVFGFLGNNYKLDALNPAIQMLYKDYRDRLLRNRYSEAHKFPYAYSTFDSGRPIPYVLRALYRDIDPDGKQWPEPFRTQDGSFEKVIFGRFAANTAYIGYLAEYITQAAPLQSRLRFAVQIQSALDGLALRRRITIMLRILRGQPVEAELLSLLVDLTELKKTWLFSDRPQ